MANEIPNGMSQMHLVSVSDEIEGNESIYEFLPYSSLRRWLYEGSVYEKALRELPLGRLGGVKSLSFLSYLGEDPESVNCAYPAHHTRYDHSLVVGIVMEEILKQNCFPQDEINKGILAGLIHDIATPAHGDATKSVDPKNLEEEDFWAEVIGKKGLDFLATHGLNEEEMDKIVHNQGVLGKVLDAADRITYTMKDVFSLYESLASPRNINPIFFPLHEITTRNPLVGDVYKDINIRRSTGEVYFSDPERLFDFLRLRAVMSKNYYHNPSSQGRDFLIRRLIEPLYSTSVHSILNPSSLRRMDDNQLLAIISQSYGAGMPICMFDELINWHPQYEVCYTEGEAREKEEELKKEQDIWVLGTRYCKGFNTASDTLVLFEGQVSPFKEAMPHKAAELDEMSDAIKGFYVFYVPQGKNAMVDSLLTRLSGKKH